jgi:PPOX class probable F420-dependent enzyme
MKGEPMVTNLGLLSERLAQDRHLAVLVTTSPTQIDPQISVVNAAVIDHPVTGEAVVAFVGRTGAKLVNLRARPRATIVARAGWEWAAVRGDVELVGPDDPHVGVDEPALAALLRVIYHAAGGNHPDLDAYDRTIRSERRCAVLLHPERVWSNPSGSEHQEPAPTSSTTKAPNQ